ncbi:MAG TPA: glycosyltransferase family 2 protein [Elusimicrobiota bacterium]|nr:glycosyltransferase family 2 protein [Elusimicrobiota bacterium]
MKKLSVIIITRNEENDLPACLESVRPVADEIVVVDSYSTDQTVAVARRFTDKVFQRTWDGFGPQKQFALEQASGEWILNVDADERLTPALRDELLSLKGADAPAHNGYEIPYEIYFLGRRLRFGGCFGEHHVRLFLKGKASYGTKSVHEGIRVTPPLGALRGRIRHESYRNFSEYLQKCNLYTELIAREKHRKGHSFASWQHLRLPWEFFIRYVLKGGFLDGQPGFIYAVLSAYYAWLKHVRLIDCERDPRP